MKSAAAIFTAMFLCIGTGWAEEPPPPQTSPATPDASAAPMPPAAPALPKGPTANIVTSMGTIVLTLDSEHAPATVKNFVRYAREGHFNGTVIYRVVPRFVIQMGSINAKGVGRPLHKPVRLETASGLKNIRATVAMARAEEPNSATAEFFINLGNNTPLDANPSAPPDTTGYAVFGVVSGGQEVVDAIAAVPLDGGYGPFKDAAPKTPIVIRSVTVLPPTPGK